MKETTQDAILPQIRKEFYALRNGMIADTLRKGGLEQKYIFGLQLPQIKELAERFRPDETDKSADLGRMLWEDRECREARLLACHLMPPAAMTATEAMEWADGAATREEADILAFRLLRYLTFANDIATALSMSTDPLKNYTATAIRRFL
ncbi:MAG: DNA alkylation repair protein [Muribaculaceae bacterium]|nr:DNA alkylation repair protein [Muribaculaceae bacterium]